MTALASIVAIGAVGLIVGSRVHHPPVRRLEPELPPRSRRRPIDLVRQWRARRRSRRRWERPAAVAVWCDDVATEIRSGSTVRAAILTVVPDDPRISDVVTRIRRRIERGSNVRDSCRALATDRAVQRGEPELSSALTVIAETAEVGGSVGVPIERVAAAARLRAADELDRAAHSAQARLSAHVLTFVPITVFVVLAIGDRRVIAIATSPSGIAIVAFGIVLNALGWLWMQAIIRGRER